LVSFSGYFQCKNSIPEQIVCNTLQDLYMWIYYANPAARLKI